MDKFEFKGKQGDDDLFKNLSDAEAKDFFNYIVFKIKSNKIQKEVLDKSLPKADILKNLSEDIKRIIEEGNDPDINKKTEKERNILLNLIAHILLLDGNEYLKLKVLEFLKEKSFDLGLRNDKSMTRLLITAYDLEPSSEVRKKIIQELPLDNPEVIDKMIFAFEFDKDASVKEYCKGILEVDVIPYLEEGSIVIENKDKERLLLKMKELGLMAKFDDKSWEEAEKMVKMSNKERDEYIKKKESEKNKKTGD